MLESMLGTVPKLSLRIVVGGGVVEVVETLDARRRVLREVNWEESLSQKKAQIASKMAITTPSAAPMVMKITTSILQSATWLYTCIYLSFYLF